MNSIEQLAKERGGAIEALSLIGLSASWIGALAAHPALFKQYLRDQKRISAKVVHPEPNRTELSNKAGDIYPAFDLLEATDDELLARAMQEFSDKFSVPRVEVINLISSLKSQKEEAEREVVRLRTLQSAYQQELAKKHSSVDASLALDMLHLPLTAQTDPNLDAQQIRLYDMRNCLFYTPVMIAEPPDFPDIIVGNSYICYISPNGELYYDEVVQEFRDKTISTFQIRKSVLQSVYEKSVNVSPMQVGFPHHAGNVIGLINSELGLESFGRDNGVLPRIIEHPEYIRTVNADIKEFLLSCKDSLVGTGGLHNLEKLAQGMSNDYVSFMGVVALADLAENATEVTVHIFYVGDFIPLNKEKGK